MAIFTVRSLIKSLKMANMPAYVCYLDATAAFDRVCHRKLVMKLLEAKVPSIIVNIIIFWLDSQSFRVKWGSTESQPFVVRRGVRQGGILSSYFFVFYTNLLSLQLTAANMGCRIAGVIVNHVCYADDICIISNSIYGLRKLLQICIDFAHSHNLEFNAEKTVLQCYLTPELSHLLPEIVVPFGSSLLRHTEYVKYLGYTMQCRFKYNDMTITDEKEISVRCGQLYKRAYMIRSYFLRCSEKVKARLCQAYLSAIYCCSLWKPLSAEFDKIRVAYNNAIRIVYGESRRSSATATQTANNLRAFEDILETSVDSLKARLHESDNPILVTILCSSTLTYI